MLQIRYIIFSEQGCKTSAEHSAAWMFADSSSLPLVNDSVSPTMMLSLCNGVLAIFEVTALVQPYGNNECLLIDVIAPKVFTELQG